MTNTFYAKAKEAFLKADLDLDGDVRIALVDISTDTDSYDFDPTDQFLSDIPTGAIVGVTGALASKTFDNGTFASSDGLASGVSGDDFEALIFYQHTGTPSTSRLIAYVDEDIDGVPATPDGGNFLVECPTAGWFTL